MGRKADILAPFDSGERVSLMEPLLISAEAAKRKGLPDLAVDLTAKSARLRSSLPVLILEALADLVRAMNCYYSNLIEGHDTHPVDIERAMNGDYSKDRRKRNLQLEAKAHVAVQKWIDDGGMRAPMTVDAICEVHRRFCELLPDELLWIENPDTAERIKVVPGKLRDHHVAVGVHVPISAGAVPRFLERFESVYAPLGRFDTIVGAAAAHHRLLWIHPFLDGNGRVARLAAHAQLLQSLETAGIWSVARGLARQEAKYKSHLMSCDEQRRHDWDGRGNLSEEALASFTQFFLETCIGQVDFMESLIEPTRLRQRVLLWAEEEVRFGTLPAKSGLVLQAVLYRGELLRGDVPSVLAVGDRQARRVVSALLDAGVLVSKSDRAPLRLAFPARLAHRWMPGLFPEAAG